MIKEIMYCDRCGKTCESTRNSHCLLLMKHRHFIERFVNGTPQKLDLCQNCYDSLEEWIEKAEIK